MSTDNPIQIGTRREVFWDDYLVEQTDAVLTQHKPQDRGVAMVCDAPWEGSSCVYPVVIRDRELVRLYYKAGNFNISADSKPGDPLTGPMVICCAESHDDGKTFHKPKYGIHDCQGSKDNNIILIKSDEIKNTDNFAVFRDTNPDCPEDERYKATLDNGRVAEGSYDRILTWLKSKDGIHFTPGGEVIRGGWFDSMNCAFWDRHTKQYYLYMRDWPEGYDRDRGEGIGRKKRDIRYAVSPDFRNWTQPQRVGFGVDDAVELYTNNVKPYHRSDHLYFGMATRYVERDGWSKSFDYLPCPDNRRNRSSLQMRYGTALTDCVLITSRDGVHFKRWDEAFMTPGIERGHNWVYGDCYFSWGMVETPADLPDMAPNELSFYAFDSMWTKSCSLRRYAIRKDGLISYKAPLKGATLTTRPIIFAGSRLMLNFATSAVGHVYVSILDDAGAAIPGYQSHEVFGDSLDRPVVFAGGPDVSALAGRPVRLKFTLRDADLYAFQFMKPDFGV